MEWLLKCWYIHTTEHYAAINKNELEVLTGEDKSLIKKKKKETIQKNPEGKSEMLS